MSWRSNIVAIILAGLLATLAIGLVKKKRAPHRVPEAAKSTATETQAKPSQNKASKNKKAPASAASAQAKPQKKPGPTLKRPLKVAAVAWELLAPALLENEGLAANEKSPLSQMGSPTALSVVGNTEAANRALSRGGEDGTGADVILVSLPSFLASYPTLRALDPIIFFVSHWSVGREVITTPSKKSLERLPSRGTLGFSTDGDEATFAALFLTSFAGIEASRLELIEVGGGSTKQKVHLHAQTLATTEEAAATQQSHVVVGTTQARRLIPFVAVTQRSFAEKHTLVLQNFLLGFRKGQAQLSEDAAAAGRKISKLEGAPEPIALLGALGRLEPVSMKENAALFGLAGRGAIHIDKLLTRGFRLWRQAKLTNAPPPEKSLVDGHVVAQAVRSLTPSPKNEPKAFKAGEGAGKALLVYRQRGKSFNEDELLAEVGLLAGVFTRSQLAVTLHGGGGATQKRTLAFIERARERFGLRDNKLVRGSALARGRVFATVEILPVP